MSILSGQKIQGDKVSLWTPKKLSTGLPTFTEREPVMAKTTIIRNALQLDCIPYLSLKRSK